MNDDRSKLGKQQEQDPEELVVSEEQIEQAMNRLFMTVQDEEVPDVWLKEPVPSEGMAGTSTRGMDRREASPGLKAEAASMAAADRGLPNRLLPEADAESKPAGKTVRAASRTRLAKRRWLSAAAAVVVAGTMLFTSWGQEVMANMLNTFRVQHFESIAISESDLSGFSQALESGALGNHQLDLRTYGEIEQSGGGTMRKISEAEAQQLAGRTLKPLKGADLAVIDYLPRQEVTFKLHPKAINKLIDLLGGRTKLPSSVEGAPIKVTLPGSFTMTAKDAKNGCELKKLIQLPAPTLDVPDDVDVEQVRQAVLDLPILPEDLRAKLSAIGDWQHTLPVPSMNGVNRESMRIDGHDALLSTAGRERMLLWLQGDWMYMLSGSNEAYPTDDALIQEAKGLMK
ncbi:hypothetical protein [Paenibacillus sp. R14(2021)]|uniref:hypothetical protein n=1 Tax=Paenibacillus sp. R14(2021) TaxID=2859228 RepID=UPI001C611504|nr:hypothetical protein [Paenibacillus sp. R14(2021)]